MSDLLADSLVPIEIGTLRQHPERDANHIGQQVRAVEVAAQYQPARKGRADSINPVGMIKLRKFDGPREANCNYPKPRRRYVGIKKSKAEKYDQRPKRVAAVFGYEVRERKKP